MLVRSRAALYIPTWTDLSLLNRDSTHVNKTTARSCRQSGTKGKLANLCGMFGVFPPYVHPRGLPGRYSGESCVWLDIQRAARSLIPREIFLNERRQTCHSTRLS